MFRRVVNASRREALTPRNREAAHLVKIHNFHDRMNPDHDYDQEKTGGDEKKPGDETGGEDAKETSKKPGRRW